MIVGFASIEVLGALKVRQETFIIPPGISQVGPMVIVSAMPTNVDHAVEGTAPAEHFSSRPVQRPVGGILLWRSTIGPILFASPQVKKTSGIVVVRILFHPTDPPPFPIYSNVFFRTYLSFLCLPPNRG